jgi:Zn-dependent M32 family carboxypeptidase
MERMAGFALSLRPLIRLAQDEESGCAAMKREADEDWRTMTHYEHLVQADRLIADCLDRIARQREVITAAYEQGLPTDIAESMLRALEESLRAFEKHRQYIVNRFNPER